MNRFLSPGGLWIVCGAILFTADPQACSKHKALAPSHISRTDAVLTRICAILPCRSQSCGAGSRPEKR